MIADTEILPVGATVTLQKLAEIPVRTLEIPLTALAEQFWASKRGHQVLNGGLRTDQAALLFIGDPEPKGLGADCAEESVAAILAAVRDARPWKADIEARVKAHRAGRGRR